MSLLSSLMGCGISKFDNIAEEGKASPYNQSSLVHRRNDRAVVDSSLLSKPLPEGGREEHAKGDIHKKVNSEEKGGIQREGVEKEEACDSEEDGDDRDDSISDIRSPSFRVYCIPSQSDDENNEGDSNPGKIKDEQQVDVKNDKKGSSTGWGKRRTGKGIKTSSGKVKKSFKSLILQSIYHSSRDSNASSKSSFGRFSW